MGGQAIRRTLFTLPPLRALDSVGGLVLGAAAGARDRLGCRRCSAPRAGADRFARGRAQLRILSEINERVPPLAPARRDFARRPVRGDPGARRRAVGPARSEAAPRPRVSRLAAERRAGDRGRPAGSGIEGSGWAAGPDLVVTNAHVVAGTKDARVDRSDGDFRDARVVYFDPRDDSRYCGSTASRRGRSRSPTPPRVWRSRFSATPRTVRSPRPRAGSARPASCSPNDAYGRGPVRCVVTTLRGLVRHGNSGGPAVDGSGRVRTTIFAARLGSDSGYGVPTAAVREALGDAGAGEVSTGPCVS